MRTVLAPLREAVSRALIMSETGPTLNCLWLTNKSISLMKDWDALGARIEAEFFKKS